MVALHQFQPRQEQLAQRLRARIARNLFIIKRAEEFRQEWIDNLLGLAADLFAARQEFKTNDRAFGAWLTKEHIDISRDDRMALLEFGKDHSKFHEILKEEKVGLHPITLLRKHKLSIDFVDRSKTPKKTAKRGQPLLSSGRDGTKAREWALNQFADGKPATIDRAVESLGIRPKAAQLGVLEAKGLWVGRQEAAAKAPIDISGLSATAQQKLEAAIAHHKRQLDMEYQARRTAEIRRHIDEHILPEYGKKLAIADEVLGRRKPPFSNAEYRQLLAALHPDSDPARRDTMFTLCKEREVQLRGIDDGAKLSSGLPTTLAELMARRTRR